MIFILFGVAAVLILALASALLYTPIFEKPKEGSREK